MQPLSRRGSTARAPSRHDKPYTDCRTRHRTLAILLPALPAASVASNAAIAVYFSPEQDFAAFVARAIDNAEREILIGAYGLTTAPASSRRWSAPSNAALMSD